MESMQIFSPVKCWRSRSHWLVSRVWVKESWLVTSAALLIDWNQCLLSVHNNLYHKSLNDCVQHFYSGNNYQFWITFHVSNGQSNTSFNTVIVVEVLPWAEKHKSVSNINDRMRIVLKFLIVVFLLLQTSGEWPLITLFNMWFFICWQAQLNIYTGLFPVIGTIFGFSVLARSVSAQSITIRSAVNMPSTDWHRKETDLSPPPPPLPPPTPVLLDVGTSLSTLCPIPPGNTHTIPSSLCQAWLRETELHTPLHNTECCHFKIAST